MKVYGKLQEVIDKLINRYGAERLLVLLQSVNIEPEQSEIELINEYLVLYVGSLYEIDTENIADCRTNVCMEVKMICMHILSRELGTSYAGVGSLWDKTKSSVHNHISKMDTMLKYPEYNNTIIQNYNATKNQLEKFKETINKIWAEKE